MRAATAGIFSLAALVLLAVGLLVASPRLPEAHAHGTTDAAIVSALAVYALCWAAVVVAPFFGKELRAAWCAGQRTALGVSAAIILAFLIWASWTILSILRSTDL